MSIKTATLNGVATIEIARPEKKNALTMAMYDAMAAALIAAHADPAVRAVLITGQPGIFTSGNDLEDFMKSPPRGSDSPVFRFMRALTGCDKPVVAAVTGAAIGIGTTMLLHCDLVYVSDEARLAMPFASLGLVAEFASSLLVPQLVGRAKAAEKLLLGDPITGAEAVELAHRQRGAAGRRGVAACATHGRALQRAAAHRGARDQEAAHPRQPRRGDGADRRRRRGVLRAAAQPRGARGLPGLLREAQARFLEVLSPAPLPQTRHAATPLQEHAMNLKGKTLFITGGSRGIGLAIAKRAAADGANVAIIAKTTDPNPKLPGTIYSAAEEIVAAGGQALPIAGDIRDEASVQAAVAQTVARFGGIDILVNNASAISLTPTHLTPMKRFDLMFGVNVRGTYLCTQACLAELIRSRRARPQPDGAEHEPAAVDEAALVPAPRGLHDGQVRHERVHAGPRRRVQGLRHRRQQPVAAHRDRDCGACR